MEDKAHGILQVISQMMSSQVGLRYRLFDSRLGCNVVALFYFF
jgi:hypothetical protein